MNGSQTKTDATTRSTAIDMPRHDLTTAELKRAGIANADSEALWLVEHASDEDHLRRMVQRRVSGEPLQYVMGVAAFRYLDLDVGPGVLIPRPETESVAERAMELLPAGGRLCDIGTGSGAIAISVATERGDATVVATDVSPDALRYARRNAQKIAAAVEFFEGDLFEALPERYMGSFDVVVSNPPYVADRDTQTLPPDVRDFEPHTALFAGPTGLGVIERLVGGAHSWLADGGWLVFEIGETQGREVRALLSARGFSDVRISTDLAGRDRIAEGRV